MEETRETEEERPRLVEDVEALAERASSLGASRRADDLRAIAEHLRAKEARKVAADVRPKGAHRRPQRAGRLRTVLIRLRAVFTPQPRR